MQGGVAIFFGNKFEYEILSNETDNEGNLLIINMQINVIKLKKS